MLVAIVVSSIFAALPGVGSSTLLAMSMPLAMTLPPYECIALMFGITIISNTANTFPSVLIAVPGGSGSQATILDGYPIAQRGEAARAFGAAFTVSAIGGVLGALILGLSIPIVKPLILSFAQPEFFMLGLLGLAMVGSLSGNSVSKGLLAALLGLMLSYVGYAINGAVPRYWFGATYLLDGLPLIPLVLGLFALPEVLELAVRNSSISRVDKQSAKGGMKRGIGDAFRNWWLVLRCTVIGAYVGMLPGLGGSIVDWVAYGHVVQSSRDKSQFGKGDVRGVIAPETANNAMKGGALLPTIAFAIPGSASMAILLGAFMMQGLEPGPEMLTTKLHITFSMMWTLAIANCVGALLLMVLANQVAKVAFIRGHLIVPAVCMFVLMGSWLSGNQMGDWAVLITFGVIGYLMKQGGVPRPPLVLGLILGPIMENALFITDNAYDGLSWLLRPMSLGILVLIVLTLGFAARSARRRKLLPGDVQLGETASADPTISLGMAALFLSVLIYALFPAISWPSDTGNIPLLTIIPAISLALMIMFQSWRDRSRARADGGNGFPMRGELGPAAKFFAWLLGVIVLTYIGGQLFALPVFMTLYLLVWGKYKWWFALAYGAGGWLFLYAMFDQLIAVMWHPSMLFP